MKIANLEDLFVHELKDIFSAEDQLTKALPNLAENAATPDLRSAFQEHFEVTRTHVERLQRIFDRLGLDPKGQKCVGMQGIIKEGDELLHNDIDASVRDAGLIAGAQKAEHYEIAVYGTASAYAKMLGHQDLARLLDQTLEEEKQADKTLTQLAESHVNSQAREPNAFSDGDDEEFDEDEDLE